MRLDGAILDFDGTLLDSMGVWETLGDEYLFRKGLVSSPGLREALRPLSLPQAADYLKEKYALPETPDQIVDQVNTLLADYYRDSLNLKEGVLPFLQQMKREQVSLCIATATDRPLVEAALERLQISDYFCGILTCAEAGAGKDRPVIYHKALDILQSNISHTVVFEDALYAVKTAKQAGFWVAGVYDPSAQHQSDFIRKIADWYLLHINDWKCET